MKLDNKIVEQKLVNFIQQETKRIGVKKAVIGLSGGIDSAVSAFLTVNALGKENVLGVLMPYKTSSKASVTDAMEVVKKLEIDSKKIEITDMVDAFASVIGDKDMSGVRKGNIMARVRMIVLYDQSAKENAIVMGTGNKTEILLGYTTLFGDSACAINPMGCLYKTQVFDLAKHLGVPQTIIVKKPSADLWEGQTDESEMGLTYADVDKYLFYKIEERKSCSDLIKLGYKEDYIEKVDKIIAKNSFKSMPAVVATL
jgi:NAD+ synthase